MPDVRIQLDGRAMQVEEGLTILQAAERAGIEIPSLCYLRGLEPCTSCYVCVVNIGGRNGLSPSCATKVADGMVIDCSSAELRSARRTALELLLSDHVGDCAGPCELACPAALDIPTMLRLIGQGQSEQARRQVHAELAFAHTLGACCQGFCEKACRRGKHDAPVAIRALHEALSAGRLGRGVLSEAHLLAANLPAGGGRWASSLRSSTQPTVPSIQPAVSTQPTASSPQPTAPSTQRTASSTQRTASSAQPAVSPQPAVCIVGSSAVALSAAHYLALVGIGVQVMTAGPLAAEILAAHPEAREQVQADLDALASLGIEFAPAPQRLELPAIQARCDAVLVADGALAAAIAPDPANGVFVAARPPKTLVHSVGSGRSLAEQVARFLGGDEKTPSPSQKPFNIHMGQLQDGELQQFLASCPDGGKTGRFVESAEKAVPANDCSAQPADLATQEAWRCLHCDCRAKAACRLRLYAERYGASASHFKSPRRHFEQQADAKVIYESGKCITCGLCVQITQRRGCRPGLGFSGRGFGVRVAVPTGDDISTALGEAAGECIQACPTGALAWRE